MIKFRLQLTPAKRLVRIQISAESCRGDSVKNPGPEDPALVPPQRGEGLLHRPAGMMEYWSNGILGIQSERYLICITGFKGSALRMQSQDSRTVEILLLCIQKQVFFH